MKTNYLIDIKYLTHCLAQALKMFAVISLDVGNVDGKEGGIKEDSQK